MADADDAKIKDAAGKRAQDKGETTNDAMNPVPRLTGDRPAKPTSARSNF